MLTAYILAQVYIFIGILIFHPHFHLNLFYTIGTKKWNTQHLLDKNVPIETAIFNRSAI